LTSLLLVPIGFTAGILAGYLGIGGGGIFVPILFYCLAGTCPDDLIPKLSVGTSKGAVIFTGLAGAIRHWQLKHISFPVLVRLAFGAFIGAFFGGFVVKSLPGGVLTYAIAIVLFIAALRMITAKSSNRETAGQRALWWLPIAGLSIGLVSAAVGIGGGIFAVPLMAGILGMETKHAAGTSAAMTVVVSSSAIVGHMFWGCGIPGRPVGSIGFVYLPDALALGIPAALGALIGAGLHKKFEPKVFKWIFAGLLIIVAVKIALF